ncbi:hypothetical protein SAMN04488029_3222 [Reichenbachiella faecimaris]|uniref:Uncharacterized protein n=1 Tax=Reichenbachiella faecimaris TaxID=692418 RepID=A0A1W2GK92_REIFA|nr:hypothetical protein [Reichenbachiella faecimaris]SMD37070.1 hypothetical protein SAMN04488029_3222 [Reichenbachiella faecimaris]
MSTTLFDQLMKSVTLILTLLSFQMAKGDSNKMVRDKDEYIISHGKTIFGDTDINLVYEDAIIRSGNDIMHYPSSQIDKVAVIDHATGDVELYHSGSFGLNQKQYLFKILAEGQATLLYREGLNFSAYEEMEYPPFFILIDNQVYSLSAEKNEMLRQLDNGFQREISRYIKEHKLVLTNEEDMIKLFNYYNLMTLE